MGRYREIREEKREMKDSKSYVYEKKERESAVFWRVSRNGKLAYVRTLGLCLKNLG